MVVKDRRTPYQNGFNKILAYFLYPQVHLAFQDVRDLVTFCLVASQCLAFSPEIIIWAKMAAGVSAITTTSQPEEKETEDKSACFRHSHNTSLSPIDDAPHLAARETGKCSLYSRWPCAHLQSARYCYYGRRDWQTVICWLNLATVYFCK